MANLRQPLRFTGLAWGKQWAALSGRNHRHPGYRHHKGTCAKRDRSEIFANVNCRRQEQETREQCCSALGEKMADNDDDPPDNVIPFGNEIQIAIARLLREMYSGILREELPQDISVLMKRFEEVTKKDSEPKS
jgi:hypothetical protein